MNTLGSDLSDRIAYIDSEEEAKSGYIRFKDEESAEIFTRSSRNSDFISARLLPGNFFVILQISFLKISKVFCFSHELIIKHQGWL